jgi:hypothetical protein
MLVINITGGYFGDYFNPRLSSTILIILNYFYTSVPFKFKIIS